MEKLIITAALTGNVVTKEMNEHIPVTETEIVEDVIKCKDAGASIVHIHGRDEEGKPTARKDVYEKILNEIRNRNIDIVTQLSTGARAGENTPEYRGQMLELKAEMASLAVGSSNFADRVNANSFELIESLSAKMRKNNIKPEIEVFDSAMISNAQWLLKKGVLKKPLHFNLVMNVPGSIKGTPKNLLFLVESLPEHCTWTVSGIGNAHIQMITMAIILGGHVRVGIEDTILYDGTIKATNEMLVKRAVRIAEELGREAADVKEARQLLGLRTV